MGAIPVWLVDIQNVGNTVVKFLFGRCTLISLKTLTRENKATLRPNFVSIEFHDANCTILTVNSLAMAYP